MILTPFSHPVKALLSLMNDQIGTLKIAHTFFHTQTEGSIQNISPNAINISSFAKKEQEKDQ